MTITFNADGRKLRTNERKAVNLFLDERDGKDCQAAEGKPHQDGNPCAGPIVIHHLDNNRKHNPSDGSNWVHFCTGHNHRAHPRGKGRYSDNSLRNKEKSVPLHTHIYTLKREQRHQKSPQMVKAELADRFFREFIKKTVTNGVSIQSDDLLDGARNAFTERYHISVDQKTMEKALDAVCNPLNGKYEIDEETNVVRKRVKA